MVVRRNHFGDSSPKKWERKRNSAGGLLALTDHTIMDTIALHLIDLLPSMHHQMETPRDRLWPDHCEMMTPKRSERWMTSCGL